MRRRTFLALAAVAALPAPRKKRLYPSPSLYPSPRLYPRS